MQHPLLPCRFAALSFTAIASSAVLHTLTENSFATLCATLSHWFVSEEVTISFEVRVNFNNDFSEAKTLPHDPAKKSYSFYSAAEVRTSLSSFRFWRQLKKRCSCYTWLFLSAITWASSSHKASTEISAAEPTAVPLLTSRVEVEARGTFWVGLPSQNHRNIRVGGDLKDHPLQPSIQHHHNHS